MELTPRTDAVEPQLHSNAGGWVKADFARQLERELAISLANQVKTQAEVERLKEALKSCWHAANTYDGNYTRACDNVMHLASPFLTS
jgi:hypothetical protein